MRLDKVAFMTDTGMVTKIHVTQGHATTWKSDNPSVAAVDENGNVTAQGPGDAVISVTDEKGEAARCHVSVDYRGQNPFIPPTWGLFIADGEPYCFDDVLYVYGSRDNADGAAPDGSVDWCSSDYHVIYSEDLIHWCDAGVSFTLDEIPEEHLNGATRLWAPDIFRSSRDGKYYLLSCTNRNRYFIAESSSPKGPFKKARVMTVNGEPLDVIDPGVLEDDDGRVYIVCPRFFVGELDPADYSRIIPETYTSVMESMSKDHAPFEGPSIRKRGDLYYYVFIEDREAMLYGLPNRMSYMLGRNPLGPYEYKGCFIQNHDYNSAGNIHGSFTEFKGQYYVFYHMPVAELFLTRSMFADKMYFNEDGTIREVLPTSSGAGGPFAKNMKIQASSGVIFSGGREDRRIAARYTKDGNDCTFYDYPYVYFDTERQYIGYRYVDLTGVSRFQIKIRTEAPGGRFLLRARERVLSAVELPDTKGQWQTVEAPCKPLGVETLYLFLDACPAKGKVMVDSFMLA